MQSNFRGSGNASTGRVDENDHRGRATSGVSTGVLNGISKKSFFKGFLTRGGSSKNDQAVNKSLNGVNVQGGNSGSMIGMGTSHLNLSNMNMQNTGMNMMRE